MSCERYGIDGPDSVPICSHGSCAPTSECLCDAGWTSRVDFWKDSHFDCDTSLLFVTTLAWIILVQRFLGSLLAAYNISSLLKETSLATFLSQTKIRVNIYWFLASIGICLWAIDKIINPENVVGASTLASVGMAFGVPCMFSGWACFVSLICSFLQNSSSIFSQGAREYFQKAIAPFRQPLVAMEFVTWLMALLVLIDSVVPKAGDKVLIASNLYIFIFNGSMCYICVMALSSFCSELKLLIDAGGKSEEDLAKFNVLYNRMLLMKWFALGFGITSPAFIAFGSSTFLRHKFQFIVMMIQFGEWWPETLGLVTQMKKRANTSTTSSSSGGTRSTARSTVSKAAVAVAATKEDEEGEDELEKTTAVTTEP